MSIIGLGNLGAINLAGSVAGSQRNNAAEDRVKEASADSKFQADQRTMSSSSLEDVAETDLLSERDADGRIPFSESEEDQQETSDSPDDGQIISRSRRMPDALGERGISLDVEA